MSTRKRKLDPHIIELNSQDENPSTEELSEEEEEEQEEEEEEEDADHENADENADSADSSSSEELEESDFEDFSTKESIRKLLDPFGKDQLIELIKHSIPTNPSLLSRVLADADSDPLHRNVFVHGLGWEATSDALSAAFSPFGNIEDCKAVANHSTGRCKGYGFVLFRSRAAARRAVKEPFKKIGGRVANCQLAYLGPPASAGNASSEITGRKLYVNNVGSNVNPERLLAFFSKFGEIEQGPLGYDPATGKLRGYALFIYKGVEGLSKALEEPKKYFEGCELQCSKAFEGVNKNSGGNSAQIAPAVATGTSNEFGFSYAPAAGFMGQNLAAGSMTGIGVPTQNYVVGSAARGSGIGVNSISPSVIGNYGSLAALQGMGAYQNSASSAAARPHSGFGSLGASGLGPFYGQ